ncbi:conserved hypothetical protein [Flavobacterium sp. 9AF]|uniref:hypothetical protein n=1 Tax=Flavobacterium sp. 9AF TaxID=2653142 RepID=UPI0012F12AAE|nr:hypothetical protein [Flavobacterium sp. 9AF]VXB15999.1 conserved hypothetical protein [Flavobacterium sp. 9AF]
MKNKIVLIILFILPIVTYLIFASAKHNSLFLPVLSENNSEIPNSWKSLNQESVQLKDKITILGFTGTDMVEFKANMFNLNQKIYNKYYGFEDFQMVMIAPIGTENEIHNIITELNRITEDMKGWKFVFATSEAIQAYYDSLHLMSHLNNQMGTSNVIILDKKINHRGRKGKNKKGEDEYRESYNSSSAADLHNEMTDDVKIILREYRLALKKNARKDDFRDNIVNEVEKNNSQSK